MKHKSCNKTDDIFDKLMIGLPLLSFLGSLGAFLVFAIIKIELTGLLLILLGVGGFFVLSYIVGGWIINRIEDKR